MSPLYMHLRKFHILHLTVIFSLSFFLSFFLFCFFVFVFVFGFGYFLGRGGDNVSMFVLKERVFSPLVSSLREIILILFWVLHKLPLLADFAEKVPEEVREQVLMTNLLPCVKVWCIWNIYFIYCIMMIMSVKVHCFRSDRNKVTQCYKCWCHGWCR